MLEYKQKRNNGRTPFAGIYKFVCVCVCVGRSCGDRVMVDNTGKITKGLFFIGTKQEQFRHILQEDSTIQTLDIQYFGCS